MSFQAYLDNITANTGETPEEIVAHARAEGLLEPGVKAMEIVNWLKDEYGLGRGHAMAIVSVAKRSTTPKQPSRDDRVDRHFSGKKSAWRSVYEELVGELSRLGPDVDVDPGKSYLSLRKAGKKFAIVAVAGERLDVGVKLKGTPATARLELAGSWNSMVTHRVRVHTDAELDNELLGWLKQAYAAA